MNHLSFFFLSAHDEMLNRRIKTQQHQLLLPMVTILKLMLFPLQNLEMESLWWELKKNTIFLNSMYTPALRHVLINWVKNYSWNDLKFKLDRIKISHLKYNSLFFLLSQKQCGDGSAICETIRCQITDLPSSLSETLTFKARLWEPSLLLVSTRFSQIQYKLPYRSL